MQNIIYIFINIIIDKYLNKNQEFLMLLSFLLRLVFNNKN